MSCRGIAVGPPVVKPVPLVTVTVFCEAEETAVQQFSQSVWRAASSTVLSACSLDLYPLLSLSQSVSVMSALQPAVCSTVISQSVASSQLLCGYFP